MAPGSNRVVVVGSINTDLVVTADRLPRPGETIPGRSFQTFQGGKGANQAVAAALLGAEVMMIGKVGTDSFGAESIRQLQGRGVDCSQVEVEAGDSGLAIITVGAGGGNSIIVVPGANAAVTPAWIESKIATIRSAGMVLTQLEIPVASVLRLAQLCRQENVPLMLDPAPAQALPDELFSLCEWITPNETEALFYMGRAEASSGSVESAAAVRTLRGKGSRGVVLKLGERGAYLATSGGEEHLIAPILVHAVDSTAAGDTFNGAFAAALCRGDDAAESGRFAAAAAASSVTRMGAQASMPSASEVDALLAERRH